MTAVLPLLDGLLSLLLLAPGLLIALFCAEILASLRSLPPVETTPAPLFAVLMPAHDEGGIIGATLAHVMTLVRPGDIVLVVADNCSDNTADVALAAGAHVAVRHDPARRGKGFALEFGVDWLSQHSGAHDVIIILDADCEPHDMALIQLAAMASEMGRPVQSSYQMQPSLDAGIGMRMSSFAFRVKNHARQLGTARLGIPALLTGSGMAFPTPLLRTATLGTSEIVEDLVLGLDCARLGASPLFCPHALVTSAPAQSKSAEESQRRRWEHGYLSATRRLMPGLLIAGIRRGNPRLLLLALDIAIPPLSLLVIATLLLTLFAACWHLVTGMTGMLWIGIVELSLLAGAVLLAWLRHGRDLLAGREIAAMPLYVLRKIPLYLTILAGEKPEWTRTDRGRTEP